MYPCNHLENGKENKMYSNKQHVSKDGECSADYNYMQFS